MPHEKDDFPAERQGEHDEQLLPPARSFVVQFTVASTRCTQPFTGRIEHIESGRSRRFVSSGELLAFFRTVLGTPEDTER